MTGQKQADHRFLSKRVDKLTQQSVVVRRCFWSPLRRNFAEDSVVLICPQVELLWGNRLLLCSSYLYSRRPGSGVSLCNVRL